MAKDKKKSNIQKKQLTLRGKSLEELQQLDVRESAKYLKSRPRRSVLRNFDMIERFIKRCEKKNSKNKKIRTHLRDLVIVPKLVGFNIAVHNGKNFIDVPITLDMVGHRLGEFSQTRSKVSHGSAGIGSTKSSRAQKK